MIPTLKVWVPKLCTPDDGELPVVTPVIVHVRVVTPQLSDVVGFGVGTLASQEPELTP